MTRRGGDREGRHRQHLSHRSAPHRATRNPLANVRDRPGAAGSGVGGRNHDPVADHPISRRSVILDDKKARRVARQAGLTVIGTLGVLLRAKRRGVVPTVGPPLTALQKAGFRMTRALYDEALRLAGEAPQD